MRTYTQEQIEYLREHYANTPMRELKKHLGKTACSIYNKAYCLGLRRSDEIIDKLNKENSKRLTELGKYTRFKKGIVPCNKGKKMASEVYSKCKPTMFKTGHKPHNTRKDGDISIRNNRGYVCQWVRVSEGNWQPLHRVTWENHNGSIPNGFNVSFKDGNTMNCDINNLELVSKKKNMERNTIARYPEDLIKAIRKVKKIEKLTNTIK